MARKAKKQDDASLNIWSGITEADFINEDVTGNIEDIDLGEHNRESMLIYAANVNLCRQLTRLSDSLKPVERRIIYAMYLEGAMNNQNKKSSVILGTTMTYHSHGDGSIYNSMVGMAQHWKKQCPLIKGKGNFGNVVQPENYASYRYTEVQMSKYGEECFFSDFDPDCVETIFNTSSDKDEPMSLPTKFPNILVNGGMGIALGNAFRIPPYNINDIVENCKKVLLDEDTADVFMYPDLPTGCDIVDEEFAMKSIVNTGKGVLRMRANIDIHDTGKTWTLTVTSVPWMVSLTAVRDTLVKLSKKGKLFIKDIQDASHPVHGPHGIETKIMFNIIIDKSHDPISFRDKLFSLTELDKSVGIDFKVVSENLSVDKLNLKDLISAWINERRAYKRRLLNKKIDKINARISLLKILIYLLKGKNIDKTIDAIRKSSDREVETNLMKLASMNSYQAAKIADLKLSALSADAKKKYTEELAKLEVEIEKLHNSARSTKLIDQMILEELDDLLKYGQPRKSKLISVSSNKYIADTTHNIIITKGNLVKKLPYVSDEKIVYGSFKNNDYPVNKLIMKNVDEIYFFDTFGRYTSLPLYEIDNNEASQYGHQLYDITKLSGDIVSVLQPLEGDLLDEIIKLKGKPYLVTATKNGLIKKTSLAEFQKIKNTKNIKCMKLKDDDQLAFAKILFEKDDLVLYSAKGEFVFINMQSISDQGKDAMGTNGIRLKDNDYLKGISVINREHKYVLIVTSKGMMKRCEIQYLGSITRRNASNGQSYIATLDDTDSIDCIKPMRDTQEVLIATRGGVIKISDEEIPVLMKKSKGKKLIALPQGTNILSVKINKRKE